MANLSVYGFLCLHFLSNKLFLRLESDLYTRRISTLYIYIIDTKKAHSIIQLSTFHYVISPSDYVPASYLTRHFIPVGKRIPAVLIANQLFPVMKFNAEKHVILRYL